MNLNVLKLILLFVMICATLVSGLAPLKVLRYLRYSAAHASSSKQHRNVSLILCLLTCFSGGVFLATCFLHLFPELAENVRHIYELYDFYIDYPIAELLSCAGFFLLFFLEEVVIMAIPSLAHSHSHGEHGHGYLMGESSPTMKREVSGCCMTGNHISTQTSREANDFSAEATSVLIKDNDKEASSVGEEGAGHCQKHCPLTVHRVRRNSDPREPQCKVANEWESIFSSSYVLGPLLSFNTTFARMVASAHCPKTGKEKKHYFLRSALVKMILIFLSSILLSLVYVSATPLLRDIVRDGYMLLVVIAMFFLAPKVFTTLVFAEPERCETNCEKINEDPPILMKSSPHAHSHGIRSITFVLALSIHSVIEGIALGVGNNASETTALFLSLLVHKVIVAFSVGLQLARTHAHQLQWVVASVFTFALMSPIGAIVGMLVQSAAANSFGKDVTITVLQGLAVGTFLYVTFFEVLLHERDNEHPNLLKLLVMLVGFSLIGLLRLVHNHEHADLSHALVNSTGVGSLRGTHFMDTHHHHHHDHHAH